MSVTPKVAFRSGSSQQGKARRASVDSKWVAATQRAPVRGAPPAAVEAPQEVVQLPGETQVELVAPRLEGGAEAENGLLFFGPVGDRGFLLVALVRAGPGFADVQFGRVQDDLAGRGQHADVDRRLAPEGRAGQVGLEDQGVVLG